MLDRTREFNAAPRAGVPGEAIAASTRLDEASPRYPGWRVVMVCFVTAVFSWGFGFYGQSVYLAELQRLTGWSTSLISTASTAYYLFSAVLVVFVGDAIGRFGPRNFLLFGIACLGAATALIGFVAAPWQLYVAYVLLSFGWAGMGVAAIASLIGPWFRERRGLAISLALNGASCGGILGTPALLFAIEHVGLASTLTAGAIVMAAVLAPLTVAWISRPPAGLADATRRGRGDAPSTSWTRRRALRSLAFWTVTAPFALALLAQVGFVVHQIALLEPRIGRGAAGAAVSVTAVAAVLGRLALGLVVDRLDQRLVSAACFLSQAAALCVLIEADRAAVVLAACGLFGLSVGNVITLPALIIGREFDADAFAMVVAFSTAIGQFTYAFGPGLLGFVRDAFGSYDASLVVCATLEVLAAGIVLVRGRRMT